MAAYSLLNAFSGFEFDVPNAMIGFAPIRKVRGKFRCFWSLDSGWGEFEQSAEAAELRLLAGHLTLKTFRLGKLGKATVKSVKLAGKAAPFSFDGGDLKLRRTVRIKEGQTLRVRLE